MYECTLACMHACTYVRMYVLYTVYISMYACMYYVCICYAMWYTCICVMYVCISTHPCTLTLCPVCQRRPLGCLRPGGGSWRPRHLSQASQPTDHRCGAADHSRPLRQSHGHVRHRPAAAVETRPLDEYGQGGRSAGQRRSRRHAVPGTGLGTHRRKTRLGIQ